MTDRRTVEDLLRELAPQVLAALVRRHGQFHLAEEATQEALLAAATQWPAQLALIEQALAGGHVGPYQLQAAIAAVHDEAATMDDTDWLQILALYDLLELAAPNPFTTLNRAVAVAEVHGPQAGLTVLDTLSSDKRVAKHHRLFATRARLHELAGDHQAAAASYQQAARLATSVPERRFLATQARRLDAGRLGETL